MSATGTWRGHAWATAKITAIYVLLGPLVGLVTLAFSLGFLVVLSGNPEGMWLTPFLLLYG